MRIFSCLAGLALLMLITSSCEFMSYDEWAMPPYEGLFTWTDLTEDAAWGNRLDHAGAVFDGKMWIMGGYNSGQFKGDTYLEDIWSSTDGIQWDRELDSAAWHGRRGHAVLTFNDGSGEALYLLGGFEVDEKTGYRQYTNDVWKSSNGTDWVQIKERTDVYADTSLNDWAPRYNHCCLNVTMNDTSYIYLLGGAAMLDDYTPLYSFKYYRDIWRSTDGIHWEEVPTENFGERSELAAYFDQDEGRFYIHGGAHSKFIETEDNYTHPVPDYNAIWYSDDGIHWDVDTSLLISRAGHELFKYRDFLWIFPGKNTSYKKFHMAWSDLFFTYRKQLADDWTLDSEGSAFNGRHSYVTLLFNDRVYVMGGETGDRGPDNDVWVGYINN